MALETTISNTGSELGSDNDRLCYATPDVPYHFSVGVVALSCFRQYEAQVATLYSPPEFDNPFGITDFDQLIRETPDKGETMEDAARRGLLEEIGATRSQIVAPLPGAAGFFRGKDGLYHKTTMYFLALVLPECVDEQLRDISEAEASLRLIWRTLPGALARQLEQRPRVMQAGRSDLSEVDQLRAALQLLDDKKIPGMS